MTKKRVTLERTYDASLADVWELWTTKEGLESWWGPDGFTTTVSAIDLRAGGELHYAMTATGAAQVAFMKREGMPVTQAVRVTYNEVVPKRRLAYTNQIDFAPGVAPYDVVTEVELDETANGVRLVVTLDVMHDEEWTKRAMMGWESQLERLRKVLE